VTAPRRRLAVLLLLACRTTGGDRPAPPVAPAPVAPAAPAPDRTPAWQRRIQAEVSALRGLPFRRPVAYGVQTRTQFRAFVREELARDMPPAQRSGLSRSYAQMGFLAEGFDLSRALEDALTTQVAAYYDPHRRALWVLNGSRPAGAASAAGDEVIAHELEHALQDQHFDLVEFDGGEGNARGLDDDERTARHFVAEGEAMFVMLAWQMGSGAGEARRLGPLAVAGLRMSVTMLAAADMVDLLSVARQGGAAGMLTAEDRADLEALARLPPVIAIPLVEPYLKGALLVSEVWGRGGWPAVDDLFRHPPASTEQVLHPAEKFLARRDPPVRIQAPALPPLLREATPLSSEVLGELGWRIYFKTHQLPDGDRAAAGWGGDRYWSWQLHGRAVVLTATRWDSEADAAEFLAAYRATLARRFPGVPIRSGPGAVRLVRPSSGLITVEQRGQDVDIVDGAVEAELPPLQSFLRATTRR
jgi:hypothetical protein